jgi:hypothetical protein
MHCAIYRALAIAAGDEEAAERKGRPSHDQ